MNRKGALEVATIISLTLLLVGFFLIVALIVKINSSADDVAAENLCQKSIALRAKTAVTLSQGESPIDLEGTLKSIPPLCKTIDKKIKGDREVLKKQIADSMARCWWMFGEGKYEDILPHEGGIFETVVGLKGAENACFMCYNLIIDQDEIEGESINPQELANFMQEKKYPRIKNITYLDYIQSYGGPGTIMLAGDIEPRNYYAVAFVAKNSEEEFSVIEVLGGVIGGAAIGFFTGGVGWLAVIGGGIMAARQAAPIYLEAERDLSSIWVSDMQVVQDLCFQGDLGGE